MKETDTLENTTIAGVLSVINGQDPGNIEVAGTLYSDVIEENTTDNGVAVSNVSFKDGAFTLIPITQPSFPLAGNTIYLDNIDGIIYKLSSSGVKTALTGGSTLAAGTNISITGGVISVVNNPTFSGNVSITSATISNSVLSGALTVSGGVGISGNLHTNTIFSNNVVKPENYIYNISTSESYTATYKTVSRFKYSGSSLHTIANIKCIIHIVNNSASDLLNPNFYYNFRIYDRSNINVIASSGNLTNINPLVVSLSLITNVPASEAVFELQVLTGTEAIGRKIVIDSLEINTTRI